MSLTAQEKTYLRDGHPHITRCYLSIFVPRVLFTGQVTNDPHRGDRQITVTTLTGSLSNVTAGQTVLVGTTDGDDDVTRRRLRSVAGAVITIDENSVIWANGQYITIIEFWELWPIFPYIELTAPYTFYKDRDIVYSDQNDTQNPVAIIDDNHFADYLDGASVSFPLGGANSYAIATGATITGYSWSSTAGTIASPSSASTTITFTSAQPDGCWVFLTVTDSNGKTHTTRRVIFVCERTGANAPYLDFGFQSPPSKDWGAGGGTSTIRVFGDADITNFPDKSLVIVWNEEFYAGTEYRIGGTNIELCGYLRGETIQKHRGDGTVTFQITTIDNLMRRHKMFSISLEDSDDPDTWWKMKRLDPRNAVHHFWYWHSTLFNITNVFLPHITTRMVASDDFVNGDLYSMAESFLLDHGIFAHICCNSSSEVYVEVDYNMLSDAERAAYEVELDLTESDRLETDISILREIERKVSFVMLSGTVYDGTTNTPLISKAPGEVPEADGPNELNIERQVLEDQDDANSKSGRAMAIVNNPLRQITIKFAGNYSFIDVAPQKVYTITLEQEDTKRGLVLTNFRLIPRTVTNNYDPSLGVMTTDVVFDSDASGFDGIPGNYPDDIPEIPEPGAIPGGALVAFDSGTGCHVRGSWLTRNGSLTGANIQDRHGGKDPFWRTKQSSNNPSKAILWKCDLGKIYRSTTQGISWTNMTPSEDPPNTLGDSPAPTVGQLDFIWYEGNNFSIDQHVFLARWQNASSEWRSWLLITEDDGDTWTWAALAQAGTDCDIGTGYEYGCQGAAHSFPVFAMLSETLVVAIFEDCDGLQYVRAGSISGTVITWGTSVWLDNGNAATVFPYYAIAGVDSTKFVIVYNSRQDITPPIVHDDQNAYVRVGTISGTTITFGTPQKLTLFAGGGLVTLYNWAVTCPDSSTVIIAAVINNPNNTTCDWVETSFRIISGTISGTTITFPSQTCSTRTGPLWTQVDTLGTNPDPSDVRNVFLRALSSTTWIMVYAGAKVTDNGRVVAGTVSGTVVTVGTPVSLPNAISTSEVFRIAALSSTKGVVYYKTTSPTNASFRAFYAIVVDVSGTTATLNTEELIFDGGVDSVSVGRAACVEYDSANMCFIYTIANDCVYGVNATVSLGNITLGTPCGIYPTSVSSVIIDAEPLDANSFGLLHDPPSANSMVRIVARNDLTLCGGFGSAKALSMDVGRGSGERLYVTYHDADADELQVALVTLPSLAITGRFSLGAATLSEVDAKTWIAYPACGGVDDNEVFFFGRMNNPASLGTVHILYSDDGGSSVTVIQDDWSTDYCSAFQEDASGKMNALRHKSATQSELWRGTSVLIKKADLPFRVNPGAFYVTNDGYIVAGAMAVASGKMVHYIRSPYTTWVDITEDYPTTGGVTALTIV